MKLRIYDVVTGQILQIIDGANNEICESIASDAGYDLDLYGWTYCDEVSPGYVDVNNL